MNRLLLRMIDRIGMMTPRLALVPAADVAKVDLLRDLRNGMNTIDLQQYRSKLPKTVGQLSMKCWMVLARITEPWPTSHRRQVKSTETCSPPLMRQSLPLSRADRQ